MRPGWPGFVYPSMIDAVTVAESAASVRPSLSTGAGMDATAWMLINGVPAVDACGEPRTD